MPFEATPAPVLAPPVVETEAQRLIREARAMVATPAQWTKNTFRDGDAYCLRGAFLSCGMGAIRGAQIVGYERQCAAYPFMVAAIREARPEMLAPQSPEEIRPIQVQMFNDDMGTTHADVLAVLDRAYDLAAKQA